MRSLTYGSAVFGSCTANPRKYSAERLTATWVAVYVAVVSVKCAVYPCGQYPAFDPRFGPMDT